MLRTLVWAAIACFLSASSIAAVWSPPVDLSATDLNGDQSQIVVDADGNATAVWTQNNGSMGVIQASTKPYGSSWQTTPDTLSPTYWNAYIPQVAVDPMGNTTAVWNQSTGSGPGAIYASTKPYGGVWQTTPDTISQSVLGTNVDSPQISVDSMGNATAVWTQSDGSNWVIQASTKLYGSSWQTTPNSLSITYWDAYIPQVAVDPMGNTTAVWRQSTGSGPRSIYASTKSYGGAWQTTPDTLNYGEDSADVPQIAADSIGNAIAVWQQLNGSNQVIQTSIKPYGGTWQATPNTLSQTDQDANLPQIAAGPAWTATAVWTQSNGLNQIIQASSTYFGPPTVTGLSSSSGASIGGNSITITGTNFVEVSAVSFGSTPAESFSVESPTTIVAVVPPGKGTVDVTVTTPTGTSLVSEADQYTYDSPSPATKFDGTARRKGKKLSLKTHWKRSSTINAYRYEIFAWNNRIETVFAWDKPEAKVRLHHLTHHISKGYKKYLHKKYTIQVVDSLGATSSFTNLNVRRHVER